MNEFKDRVAVITGGAHGIGKTLCSEFEKRGTHVCTIDLRKNDFYTGDLANEADVQAFAKKVIDTYGRVDYLVNNAMLHKGGLKTCSYEEFNYVLRIGLSAPFLLTKLLEDYFSKEASIVNISSSRDRMSQPDTESYTAAKGGISALTRALAVSLAGRVRVNSVSPGWIDTDFKIYEGADAAQHPVGRVGDPLDIANAVLFLCSQSAGFITGEDLCVDGGMTKQMIYHGDFGWEMTHKIDRRE